jgi:hypothetical protein
MKSVMKRGAAALFAVFALGGVAQAANVEEVVRETQRITVEDNQVSMVWWLPLEFWSESVRANPAITAEARSEIITEMSDYTVIALLRARAGEKGLEQVQPKEELLKNTRVEFDGKLLAPLAADKVSPTATLVLAQLKPVLAQAAGPIGESLEFLVYPAKLDGKAVDAGVAGKLAVTFYGKPQQWRLPLGSVLPAKTDTATGEVFPGNFEFNPFTGKKIEIAK